MTIEAETEFVPEVASTPLQLPDDFDWSLLFPADAGNTDWMDDALCVDGIDPDAFFPPKHRKATAAKRLCQRCSVADECLAYSQTTRTPEGVWGAASARQRRKMRGDLERAVEAGDVGVAL